MTLDTHAAEGSVMPLIVNSIILHLITQRTPWLFRPLVGFVLGKLRAIIVEPGLRTHAQMVHTAVI